MSGTAARRQIRRLGIFAFLLLVIEFLDEFVFGAREAAWPLIRTDLGLSYEQIGLLLSVPTLFVNLVEPFIGILGDVWRRRVLVLGGGVLFGVDAMIVASSQSFGVLLISSVILAPASGAFVSLAQSTLMDIDPSRHEHNMARWTFAGSLGVLVGSLTIGAIAAAGLSWRAFFFGAGVLTFVVLLLMWRRPFPKAHAAESELPWKEGMRIGISGALRALRRREVWRWLILLEFSNMMIDLLYGYLALYFVDIVGIAPEQAVLAVTVWTGVGLLGDFLLIPLLERVRGLPYLRISALIELILFPSFLLIPSFEGKLICLGLLGFFNAGWYSILQGQLYSAMPGQSGTVMAVGSVSGTLGGLLPLLLGVVAGQFGLNAAMWLLMLGPIALLIGLPRPAITVESAPVSGVTSQDGLK